MADFLFSVYSLIEQQVDWQPDRIRVHCTGAEISSARIVFIISIKTPKRKAAARSDTGMSAAPDRGPRVSGYRVYPEAGLIGSKGTLRLP